MYKAIEMFGDEGIIYNVGDEYPQTGKIEKDKIKRLLSNDNGLGKPVIEEVKKKEVEIESSGYDY